MCPPDALPPVVREWLGFTGRRGDRARPLEVEALFLYPDIASLLQGPLKIRFYCEPAIFLEILISITPKIKRCSFKALR